jgi:hypothetical protein
VKAPTDPQESMGIPSGEQVEHEEKGTTQKEEHETYIFVVHLEPAEITYHEHSTKSQEL